MIRTDDPLITLMLEQVDRDATAFLRHFGVLPQEIWIDPDLASVLTKDCCLAPQEAVSVLGVECLRWGIVSGCNVMSEKLGRILQFPLRTDDTGVD